MKSSKNIGVTLLLIQLFLLIFTNISFSQFNEWKNYTSLNSTSDFAFFEDDIWVTTNGGLYKFNKTDSTYSVFRKSEGLKSQVLTAIAISNNGKIWVGSQEGYIIIMNQNGEILKNIFDIYNFDNEQKRINSIRISGDSVLVAYDFGISILSDNSLEFIETAMKFGDFNMKSKVNYAVKIDGIICLANVEGIAIQKENTSTISDPESWNSFPITTTSSAPIAFKLSKFGSKTYISTENGLYFYENGIVTYLAFSGNSLSDISVYENELYVATGKKLYKMQNSAFIFDEELTTNIIKFNLQSEGNYFATSEGLQFINPTLSEIIFPNGPTTNLFNSISVDSDGIVWVGSGDDTYGRGIYEFDGGNWTIYNKSNQDFYSNSYHNVYAAKSGTKYFNNWGYGFTTLQNENFKNFTTSNTSLVGITTHPNFLVISNSKEDNAGNLWVLNYWSAEQKPLSVMKSDSSWVHFEPQNISISDEDRFDQLIIDQNGTKWFGMFIGNNGLFYFNDNNSIDNLNDDTWGILTTSDGLAGPVIQALALDDYGQLWVGTNSGVNIISNPNYPEEISEVYALKNFNVTSIYVDPLNRKWIGTSDGIYYVSSDGFTVYAQFDSKNSPLATNSILSIGYDEKNGIVYFASDFGMSSLSTEAILPKSTFSEISTYPAPFVLSKNENLTIDGLIANSQVKIFDITGNLINSSEEGTIYSPGGRVAIWDGKKPNGEKVDSGIYLLVAYNSEGKESSVTKIAVLK